MQQNAMYTPALKNHNYFLYYSIFHRLDIFIKSNTTQSIYSVHNSVKVSTDIHTYIIFNYFWLNDFNLLRTYLEWSMKADKIRNIRIPFICQKFENIFFTKNVFSLLLPNNLTFVTYLKLNIQNVNRKFGNYLCLIFVRYVCVISMTRYIIFLNDVVVIMTPKKSNCVNNKKLKSTLFIKPSKKAPAKSLVLWILLQLHLFYEKKSSLLRTT